MVEEILSPPPAPSSYQLDLMAHALGVADRANTLAGLGGSVSYRNHYLSGVAGRNVDCWRSLVAMGLATGGSALSGNNVSGMYWRVTDTGRQAVTAARKGWLEERRQKMAEEVPSTGWSRHQLWMWLLDLPGEATSSYVYQRRVAIHPGLTKLTRGQIRTDLNALVAAGRAHRRVERDFGTRVTYFRAASKEHNDDIPF